MSFVVVLNMGVWQCTDSCSLLAGKSLAENELMPSTQDLVDKNHEEDFHVGHREVLRKYWKADKLQVGKVRAGKHKTDKLPPSLHLSSLSEACPQMASTHAVRWNLLGAHVSSSFEDQLYRHPSWCRVTIIKGSWDNGTGGPVRPCRHSPSMTPNSVFNTFVIYRQG